MVPEKGVGLVHTRLSVIDLSSAGHQPMWNDDRSIAIVFNGEIYNFRDLRRELESLGYVFRSRTDTEVLLHGYKAWGLHNLLEKTVGMFAFAIWDERKGWLWLARDRLGQKPLYYYWDETNRTLVFASEIKALLVWPFVRRDVCPKALHCYLALGYVPAPYTMFHGIAKLPPGHILLCDGKRIQVERYWKLTTLGYWQAHKRKYLEAIRGAVSQAVARRLVSDVPLGAFLSGGVDSSIIVGLMAQFLDHPVRTFSTAFEIGPRSPKYNVDAKAAEEVARAFRTHHTRLTVRTDDLLNTLLKVVWHMDEPHANPTLVATYLLARLVKEQGVTVVLSGDGGDELFGGYTRYLADRIVDLIRQRIPLSLRILGYRLLQGVNTRTTHRLFKAVEKSFISPRTSSWYLSYWQLFGPQQRRRLLLDSWAEEHETPNALIEERLSEVEASGDQDILAYLDLSLWIAEESNMRVDKMSMAHALEVRAPFLDHKLVELAFSIPFTAKAKFREGKVLLKEAFNDLLPEIVLNRPKWGWFSPVYYWVKDALWDEIRGRVLRLAKTGIFSSGVLKYRQREVATLHSQQTWALFVFSLWYDMFVEDLHL